MFKNENFISLALAGAVMMDEIDDYIDQWHENPTGKPLHEYLGMTRDEYALWLTSPDMLPLILAARKRHEPLEQVANENFRSMRIAARAGDSLKIKRLRVWLQGRGEYGDAP